MTYETTIKLKGAILTQNNVSELIHRFVDFFPKLSIEVKYSDSTKISNIKADEFQNLSFKNKQIESIDIWDSCYDDDGRLSVWLRYDKFYDLYEIKYEFSNHDKHIKFSDVINEWVTEVSDRKKYISILHLPISGLMGSFIFFIPLWLLIEKYSFDFTYLLLSLLGSCVIYFIVNASVKYSFPLTELDIGINRHKLFRKFVWGIIGIIIIPAIINIII